MATMRDRLARAVTVIAVVAAVASDSHVDGQVQLVDVPLSAGAPLVFDVVVHVGRRTTFALDPEETGFFADVFAETDEAGALAITRMATTLFAVNDADERALLSEAAGEFVEGEDGLFSAAPGHSVVVPDCAPAPCDHRFELEVAIEATEPFAAIANLRAGAFNYVSTDITVELTQREPAE